MKVILDRGKILKLEVWSASRMEVLRRGGGLGIIACFGGESSLQCDFLYFGVLLPSFHFASMTVALLSILGKENHPLTCSIMPEY